MDTLNWTATINEGVKAYRSYLSKAHNPYDKETARYNLWNYGWDIEEEKEWGKVD